MKEFTFHTTLDLRALTVMARTLRKTVRRKRSRRSHVIGWIAAALGLLLSVSGGVTVNARSVVTWAVVAVMIAVLIWEDRINGAVARKRMLPGTETAGARFDAEGYTTVTDAGETRWHYDRIGLPVKTGDYYVFVFSASHAQIYDVRTLTGGTPAEFEAFVETVTGKTMQRI